ncbi:MAG: prolipoprotein diacylglyceryl transferase [Candidatus Omnitrophica bacterium]|nr:prolipoprotein diacylglyceryl transferase [Candidatus Omnitrophota bacterium]
MYPILFSIGPIRIYSYGVMLAVAFLTVTYLISRRAELFKISKDAVNNLTFVLLISGILGARIFYILLNIRYFIAQPLEALMIHKGGLVFYGAFIIAFISGLIFVKLHRLSVLDTADLVVPFVAMAHSIGRIGCFLNGCCYGRPTDSFIGTIPSLHSDIRLWPTQIISSMGLFVIFGLLFYKQARRRFRGEITACYLMLYGSFRFGIEFMRGDLYPVFYNLTPTQLVSIGFVIAGLVLYFVKKTDTNTGDASR